MNPLSLYIFLFLLGCGKLPGLQKSSTQKQDVSAIYSAQSIKVSVYYEEGAEPYTHSIDEFENWTLTEKNLAALLMGRTPAPTIIVPKNLSEMTKISTQNKSKWSLENVLTLAKNYPTTDQSFQIFFLNGRSKDSDNVIGFHISDTKIIAIFKEVIKQTANPVNPMVPDYVEQATVIHELGHAFGLVNNGLPMVSSHQDTDHGAHCTNKNCVMYYANEGHSNLMGFVIKFMTQQTNVMFDNHCLSDAQNFKK